MTASPSPSSPPLAPIWSRLVFGAAVLLTSLAAIKSNVADPDLWGHVEFGREVLRTGSLPQRTTWSFTSNGRWVNHENLAEISLAWVYDHAGIPGLLALKLALTATIFGLMIWRARRHGVPWLLLGFVLLLVGRTMQFHWHFRPHVFGFAFFALIVALLDWTFENWSGEWRPWTTALQGVPAPRPDKAVARLRWLWLGPPILMLWTNTHGGYAAGTAIWCTYLVLRIAEAWCWWGTDAVPLIKRLMMMIGAAVLAVCFNPYGPQLHLWLAEDVWLPRPEISDWHPLWTIGSEAWPFLFLLGTAALSLFGTERRRDLTQIVILTLVLWQSVSHVRHVLFFAVLCGFWIPAHLASAWDRLRQRIASTEASNPHPFPSSGSWFAPAAALAWSAFVLVQLVPTLTSLPVDTTRYPVAAMQFLRDHKLYGRTVVAFNWSQYAIACFAADPDAHDQARVAVDGRLRTCYSQETIDLYLDLFLGATPADGRYRSPKSGPCEPERALTHKDPDLLLLETHNAVCREALERAGTGWKLLYQDPLAQVWGRDSFASRTIAVPQSTSVLAREVNWPALPVPRVSAISTANR